ncbi:hypothetical protein [Flavobacterium sp. CSZ]|uniref:hypothetical protein n=1 Tax=Flavobacterium sp. CSZ TaxID=2783791 RepID=UPI001889C84D|nr:hypothetical protein [Flavobacterium sp. CSZ]MBF4487777.1 hypothetical protein [Flavobacterium sp. CSZ]
MFTNISWGNYIIAVSILLLIWYLILGFRCYYPDLRAILSGEKSLQSLSLKSNPQEKLAVHLQKGSSVENKELSLYKESFDTLADAEELSGRIQGAIKESAERNLSLEEFQNYLKLLLSEYPFVRISTLRENINAIIVKSSASYPALLLTLSQVDLLWEESI